jgi:hypothetical protein
VSFARPVLGPNEQAVVEALARTLRQAGLPATVARRAVSLLFYVVRGTAQTVAESRLAAAGGAERAWWAGRVAALRRVAKFIWWRDHGHDLVPLGGRDPSPCNRCLGDLRDQVDVLVLHWPAEQVELAVVERYGQLEHRRWAAGRHAAKYGGSGGQPVAGDLRGAVSGKFLAQPGGSCGPEHLSGGVLAVLVRSNWYLRCSPLLLSSSPPLLLSSSPLLLPLSSSPPLL